MNCYLISVVDLVRKFGLCRNRRRCLSDDLVSLQFGPYRLYMVGTGHLVVVGVESLSTQGVVFEVE